MQPDSWQRVRALFPELVGVPAAYRAKWLDEHCAGDPEVRGHLERLIIADQGANPVLEPLRSVEPIVDRPVPSLLKGMRIGQYELHELIAVGGTGTVWRAEQLQPRRVVALKALRAELSGPESTRRFRAEAEIRTKPVALSNSANHALSGRQRARERMTESAGRRRENQ